MGVFDVWQLLYILYPKLTFEFILAKNIIIFFVSCEVIWWDEDYNDILRWNKFLMSISSGLSFLLIA